MDFFARNPAILDPILSRLVTLAEDGLPSGGSFFPGTVAFPGIFSRSLFVTSFIVLRTTDRAEDILLVFSGRVRLLKSEKEFLSDATGVFTSSGNFPVRSFVEILLMSSPSSGTLSRFEKLFLEAKRSGVSRERRIFSSSPRIMNQTFSALVAFLTILPSLSRLRVLLHFG